MGTGEKGFKTLELRLIGPTLIACGLLCCLIRVLLCAVPSTCFRNRKKTRLKSNACPHESNRYLSTKFSCAHESDFVNVDKTSHRKSKKKVSIVPPVPPNHSLPSTSTAEYKELPQSTTKISIPEIHLPNSFSDDGDKSPREDSIIELQALDLTYDIQSISSSDSDSKGATEAEKAASKFIKSREPVNSYVDNTETCLSIVLERNDNSESSDGDKKGHSSEKQTHSGIVLSPLQLGQ